jgi:5-carboxymethyl-2-hydroxymuconate isomerase
MYGPQLLALIKRYFTRIKRKPPVNCVVLEQRIEELEQQYKHRQNNFKQRVREEVIEYLEQLKK